MNDNWKALRVGYLTSYFAFVLGVPQGAFNSVWHGLSNSYKAATRAAELRATGCIQDMCMGFGSTMRLQVSTQCIDSANTFLVLSISEDEIPGDQTLQYGSLRVAEEGDKLAVYYKDLMGVYNLPSGWYHIVNIVLNRNRILNQLDWHVREAGGKLIQSKGINIGVDLLLKYVFPNGFYIATGNGFLQELRLDIFNKKNVGFREHNMVFTAHVKRKRSIFKSIHYKKPLTYQTFPDEQSWIDAAIAECQQDIIESRRDASPVRRQIIN